MADQVDGVDSEQAEADIVHRLRLLAAWVEDNGQAEPDLRIFACAAEEIERLRSRIQRITQLAQAAFSPEAAALFS